MYRRDEGNFSGAEMGAGGGAAAIVPTGTGLRALVSGAGFASPSKAPPLDLAVDLGMRIGSGGWWRGLATCLGLCAAAIALAPGLHPIVVPAGAVPDAAAWAEMRAQAIAPYAYGADTGRKAPPSALVERLADTPERPQIQLAAAIGAGDGFVRALERAGVAGDEARQAADLVADAVPLDEIRPGTRVELTLGRRPTRDVPRPLDHLGFRARLELALAIDRKDGRLALERRPIAVDETPLRISGRVGAGLFAAARAAGAPIGAVETYLKALAQHLSITRDVHAGDRYDLIIAHRRAATGESETGGLLYAGLDQGRKALRLLKWNLAGREQWFDAAGVGEQHGEMKMPVAGHLTSTFGMRFHPILGYSRMHQGVDYGAPFGAPIVAASDGIVRYSGWHGGHGNFVSIEHAGGLGSGYAHMSRIVARAGQHVAAGQLIGYVGATGLATGPHLHFEVYRNGVPVNPATVRFTQAAQLAGTALASFKATLARLLSVHPR